MRHKRRKSSSNPSALICCQLLSKLSRHWRSVVAWGRFEELDGLEAALAIGLLVDQLLPHVSGATIGPIQSVTPHGKPELGPDTVVYCIRLKQKTGRFERA